MAFESVGMDSLFMVALLAAIVAFFYSNLGLGGGQLYVPIMDLFFVGLVMKDIIPLSLCFAFATMASATFSHSRKKLVDFRLGAMLACGGLVGVIGGVLFTTSAADWQVKTGFAALLLTVATKMLLDLQRPREEGGTQGEVFGPRRLLAGLAVSVLTGFLIGSFGIGGGVVSVPLIIYVFRFETRKAIGTSALMGSLLTPAAFAAYALREGATIHYDLALALTPIVLVMAVIGSSWGLKKLKTRSVRAIFVGGVYLAACEMVYSLLTQ